MSYRSILILTLSLLASSCAQEINESLSQTSSDGALTVDVAKAVFESQVSTSTKALSDVSKKPGGLFTGDMTLSWDKAVTSQNEHRSSVDVPILCQQYRYQAIRSEFRGGCAKAYSVEVSQKIVVVKDSHTGAVTPYILSLIPDKDYYSHNKGNISEKFLNAGKKGKFSGIVMYHDITGTVPVSVARYSKGKRISVISVFENFKTREAYLDKVSQITGEIRFGRSNVVTRSFGEDWWNWDDDNYGIPNPGNDDSCGYPWWYYQDGGIVIDTDGDGRPDQYIINPSYCYPEDPGPDPNDPDPDPNDPDPDPINPNNPDNPEDDPNHPGGGNSMGGEDSGGNTTPSRVLLPFSSDQYRRTGGYRSAQDYPDNPQNCMDVARKIMFQVLGDYNRSNEHRYYTGQTNILTIKTIIDSHLILNKPIIVGVDHSPGDSVNKDDNKTDHFVVIYGRGYDQEREQYYFLYIETARGTECSEQAVIDTNRIFYDEDEQVLVSNKEYTYKKRTYVLSQIRDYIN